MIYPKPSHRKRTGKRTDPTPFRPPHPARSNSTSLLVLPPHQTRRMLRWTSTLRLLRNLQQTSSSSVFGRLHRGMRRHNSRLGMRRSLSLCRLNQSLADRGMIHHQGTVEGRRESRAKDRKGKISHKTASKGISQIITVHSKRPHL